MPISRRIHFAEVPYLVRCPRRVYSAEIPRHFVRCIYVFQGEYVPGKFRMAYADFKTNVFRGNSVILRMVYYEVALVGEARLASEGVEKQKEDFFLKMALHLLMGSIVVSGGNRTRGK